MFREHAAAVEQNPLREMAFVDLKKYGAKLLDNSISNDELREFFDKYNGPSGGTLDNIMNRCFNYLDDSQLYRLCKRLLQIEAIVNGHNKSFLRNKSPATICLIQLMTRVGHTRDMLEKFIACKEPSDFFSQNFAIRAAIIGHLFKFIFTQFPAINASELGSLFIFNGITTPLSLYINKLEDRTQIMAFKDKMKIFTETHTNEYRTFQRHMHYLIADYNENFEMPMSKSIRDIQNDQIALANEVAQLADEDQQQLNCTWPKLFRNMPKTPAEEDLIQKILAVNVIKRNSKIAASENNFKQTILAVYQIEAMIDVISLHHQHWLDDELHTLTINFYNQARKKLMIASDANIKAHCQSIPKLIEKTDLAREKTRRLVSHANH